MRPSCPVTSAQGVEIHDTLRCRAPCSTKGSSDRRNRRRWCIEYRLPLSRRFAGQSNPWDHATARDIVGPRSRDATRFAEIARIRASPLPSTGIVIEIWDTEALWLLRRVFHWKEPTGARVSPVLPERFVPGLNFGHAPEQVHSYRGQSSRNRPVIGPC